MQTSIRLTSPETVRVATAIAKTTTPKTTMPPRFETAAPDWKPQPCGLSRQELRRIVRKILG